MENPNPIFHTPTPSTDNDILPIIKERLSIKDEITPKHLYSIIKDINDPEYPNSLEELGVVLLEQCHFKDGIATVFYTPTIPHCSMATLIGLSIRIKLWRFLPKQIEIDVFIMEGKHVSQEPINKQLNDVERVSAALENKHLRRVLEQCLGEERQVGIAFS